MPAGGAAQAACKEVSWIIKAYQIAVSPLVHLLAGPGAGCRFQPSCSHYADEAVRRHGLFRGATLAFGRILRCHPFSRGGEDPVP
jgi:putative membrane protein insertion efficiency factor